MYAKRCNRYIVLPGIGDVWRSPIAFFYIPVICACRYIRFCLVQLLRLLLRVAHHLETGGSKKRQLQRRGRRYSVSSQTEVDAVRSPAVSERRKRRGRVDETQRQQANVEGHGDMEDEESDDAEQEQEQDRVVQLPESLEATVFLLARLQAVMTRAWDPAEVYPVAAGRLPGADNDGRIAPAMVTPGGGVPTGATATVFGCASGSGSVTAEYGSSGNADNDEEDEDTDPLADSFVGSTRRTRKWAWIRCSHAPINPVLASGGGGKGGRGRGGSSAQPVVAPVAIDPDFCHKTLRPGKPGPEGCTLEQVMNC